MWATSIATSSWNELVGNTTKELKAIRGGVQPAIISYTLSLPTKFVEAHVVIISNQVERLEEPLHHKMVFITRTFYD